MTNPVPIVEIHRESRRGQVARFHKESVNWVDDQFAVEEPLEIRVFDFVDGDVRETPLSVTMRTPGDDVELAIGFMVTEGIVQQPSDIERVRLCGGGNIVNVHLRASTTLCVDRLKRNFYTTSSCGVCGKTAIEAVNVQITTVLEKATPRLSVDAISELPETLRSAQEVFERTGGLHASGLFTVDGKLIRMHEDVGRHNALDKLIGAQWYEDEAVFADSILLVSGRVSFELVQKALVAGIPALAAVGAPSSLAIDLATSHHMTLIGFLRGQRFNVYAGFDRLLSTGHPCHQ